MGRWKHHLSQGVYPRLEQSALVFARSAIRIVGGKRLFRKDVQAGEQAQGFVEIEVVDVTPPWK
jgi:hypothetical protein